MSEEVLADHVESTPLLNPAGGTPEVIANESSLEKAIAELEFGIGPFAIDAERASGYKYSARAYLIQIKRRNGGLHLIDPIPFMTNGIHPLFRKLNELINSNEIILHASTQDLPCLREVGINPTKLFDTELAGRLVGLPRVGLGALTENLLGKSLAKEHSAVDWSIRPLPIAWLTYAALDVELLVELREKMAELLIESGKLEWAEEEFTAILKAPPSEKRKDPWRRTSGMHRVKKRNLLAIIRSLWYVRDDLAREKDVAPSKLLSDAAIVELAVSAPKTQRELEKCLRPLGARARWFENARLWLDAIEVGVALPESEWPELRAGGESMPPVKLWKEKFPTKYAPLTHARFGLENESSRLKIPVENLISPEIVRKICWDPPSGSTMTADSDGIATRLRELGARPWQIRLVAPILASALLQRVPLTPPPEGSEGSESEELRNI